jgi:hypothetical protein
MSQLPVRVQQLLLVKPAKKEAYSPSRERMDGCDFATVTGI